MFDFIVKRDNKNEIIKTDKLIKYIVMIHVEFNQFVFTT